ncbi:MAG: AAC(3) family N-acetyltransferase [Clostridia bacterium]|nr:AAC(3) family N-acetyltransferase [Clostridia bacterium]
MYTRQDLLRCLEAMDINPRGVLLVHSSMKAIGEVEGRADTVLDAFIEYMRDGLLVFPTHTWSTINRQNPVMYAATEPACTGILPNLFLKRPGVVRSLHPTHSVAALGADARDYVRGEQLAETPCARGGCWGKLVDRDAQILFLGCRTTCNTLLHGTEEWENIPDRLETEPQFFTVVDTDGARYPVTQYRHNDSHPSRFYDKMEPVFAARGAMRYGRFGDAPCAVGSAAAMNQITAEYLAKNPRLFSDETPIESPLA